MTKEKKNFSNQQTPSVIKLEYHNCNFTQTQCAWKDSKAVGVRLFPGDDTPRTFINCNMTNCEPPPGSVTTNCNTAICERNLVIENEDIVIDGFSIVVDKKRVFRKHGHYDAVAQTYAYLPVPQDVEVP